MSQTIHPHAGNPQGGNPPAGTTHAGEDTSQLISQSSAATRSGPLAAVRRDPALQAFWLLRIAFTAAPILFGLDKFAHVMTNWDEYLAPEFTDLFNARAHTLMYFV